MTETPGIPEEAYERATDAIAALLDSWPASASHPFHPELGVRGTLRAFAIYALEAAFPEPNFTASEVKELTTKATEVALALGRKEAQFECAAMLEDRASGMAGSGTARLLFGIAQGIRNFASRPQGATSEPLTAPTGHSDLPPIPEACKCGQDSHICAPWLYMGPWHDESCRLHGPMPPAEELLAGERYDARDLPEGRDQ